MTSLVRPRPDVPASHCGQGELVLRYEDVSQDGRLGCRAMTHGIGPALFANVLRTHPASRPLAKEGIVPILSRITVESRGGPIGVQRPVSCDGAFSFVKTTDARGKVRLRADMWVDVSGREGRTYGPTSNDAKTIPLGAMIAEHVLTRPFGPPEQRNVDQLPEGIVPNEERAWSQPETLLELPPEATWLEAEATPDPSVTQFGLGHTDSNQHVNSLVYPLMFEEAALRRAALLGERARSFCHWFDVAFRKPYFAGDAARVSLRAYRRAEAFGVVATIVDASDASVTRTFGRLELAA
jgi:hypothetical protein